MSINVADYYSQYGAMVKRRCLSILKDEEAADDAMQEVFMRLLKNRDRLKDEYPVSLLYRIATNISLNMIRDGKKDRFVDIDPVLQTIAGGDNFIDRIGARQWLDRLFKNEPASTRQMATMFYVDGLTYEQVAEETGLSVSGIRKRLRIFKEKLQKSGAAGQLDL